MLNLHDDPDTARDLGLSVIEAEIERLPQPLGHYRDRAADIAAKLYEQACEHSTCESQAPPNSGGPGGNLPSPARALPSTKWTPKPDSSPSESSATATGRKGHTSPPASGGKARSTPKPANSYRLKNAARKSTASSSTPGAPGHG